MYAGFPAGPFQRSLGEQTPLSLNNGVTFGELSADAQTITVTLDLETCDIDDLTHLADFMSEQKELAESGDTSVTSIVFSVQGRTFESSSNAHEFVNEQCSLRYEREFTFVNAP